MYFFIIPLHIIINRIWILLCLCIILRNIEPTGCVLSLSEPLSYNVFSSLLKMYSFSPLFCIEITYSENCSNDGHKK